MRTELALAIILYLAVICNCGTLRFSRDMPRDTSFLKNKFSKLPSELVVVSGSFEYGCPSGYSYINSTYLSWKASGNLNFATANSIINSTARLAGGGFAWYFEYDSGLTLEIMPSSAISNATDYNSCGKWILENITLSPTPCNENLTPTLVQEDVLTHSEEICKLINDASIVAHFGLFGTVGKTAGVCKIAVWSAQQPNHYLCGIPTLYDVEATNATVETLCGDGLSLISVEEVLADQETYCEFLPNNALVRLAGGAAMGKTAVACAITNTEPTVISSGLCANATRNEVPIPSSIRRI